VPTNKESAKDRALRAVRAFQEQFQEARVIHRAAMGHSDGSTIRVPNRPDLVYVRIKALGGAQWKVLNDKVSDIWNLPVLVEKVPVGDVWQVIDVDKSALLNVGTGWDGNAYPGKHAWTHQWPDRVRGPDAVEIYPRALVPLRSYSRSYSGLYVNVAPYSYTYNNQFKQFTGGELDLSSHQPASGKARFVLTYLDPRDNLLYSTPGNATTYSSTITPPLPGMPSYAIPSALIRLWGDQQYVSEGDIIDYRILLGMNVPDQAGAVKNAAFVVMAADTTLTDERVLVAGSYIDITDGGAGGNVTVAGKNVAPDSAQYVTLTYSPDLTAERMLLAGANVTITDQGPGKGVVIASSGGGGGGAPTDAKYLALATDATLTDERVFTVGEGLSAADAGAGSTYTVSLSIADLTEKTTTDESDIYYLEEADADKRKQTYATLMQEMRQRVWFFGG